MRERRGKGTRKGRDNFVREEREWESGREIAREERERERERQICERGEGGTNLREGRGSRRDKFARRGDGERGTNLREMRGRGRGKLV